MDKKMRSFRLEDYIMKDLLMHGKGKASKGIRNMVSFLKQPKTRSEFKKFVKRENG